MKNQSRLVPLFYLLLVVSCNSPVVLRAPAYRSSSTYKVYSLKTLLQNNAQPVGENIEVKGILSYSFENVCIYSSDIAYHKAIYIEFATDIFRHARKGMDIDSIGLCAGKEVTIRGRFSTSPGHLGNYAGTIGNAVFLACE